MTELIFNHIAFPPRLPGRSDSEGHDLEIRLFRRLLNAVDYAEEHSNLLIWAYIRDSLKTSINVLGDGYVHKCSLRDAFRELQQGRFIIAYIEQQNACLFIRRPDEKNVILEAFEVSPAAKQTLASTDALQWDFPGLAVSVPADKILETSFLDPLTSFIQKASLEGLDQFAAKTKKAGVEIVESRDTVDPALITQFLMAVVEVHGARVDPPRLRKRVKDDVCWNDAELPWRRSPLWLILRVCVQRILYLSHGELLGRMLYKLLLCSLMAQLLKDCLHLEPEKCNFLKTKLCRRLAKLETEKVALSNSMYLPLFEAVTLQCWEAIKIVTDELAKKWTSFKEHLKRHIPKMPDRADTSDLILRLPNSIGYIRDVLERRHAQRKYAQVVEAANLSRAMANNATEQFETMRDTYYHLAGFERGIELDSFQVPARDSVCEELCIEFADQINNYLVRVGGAYNGNPEQMSIFILCVFDLWVRMDRCMVAACPLLKDYHSSLQPALLDVLLLSRLSDMKRLQSIQLYLYQRNTAAIGTSTIFDPPASDGFANRYFNESAHLAKLHRDILAASSSARQIKENKRQTVNARHEDLTQKLDHTHCTELQNPDGSHNITRCDHCKYLQYRRRLQVKVHEDFLSSDSVQSKTTVFELNPPEPFAAYRDTTWNIICTLSPRTSQPIKKKLQKPQKLLREYAQLQRFHRCKANQVVSLASKTKSFLGTHYKWKKLPVEQDQVLLPLGLRFQYYDKKREIWLQHAPPLTLAHHFAFNLPLRGPFFKLYTSSAFAADKEGLSSYETVASITDCPPEISTHEFMAHQHVLAGTHRRWMSILTELGSSNIDFSLPETMKLFQRIIFQAGPQLQDDHLRAAHIIFRDPFFCARLIEQITQRVNTISTNWREQHYMDILLSMTIQLVALGCAKSSSGAQQLLLRIRQVTHSWAISLRQQMHTVQEVDTTENIARHCFLSAMLCRRTFTPQVYEGYPLDADGFQCIVEATLAMQESLIVNLDRLSETTRNILIRDLKMSASLGALLTPLLREYPHRLEAAINTMWRYTIPRKYSKWVSLPAPDNWWVTSTVLATDLTASQQVHYHLLEGHLLIDSYPVGKLPPDIRDSTILKEIFGNQRLFAYPSSLPEMSYVLAGTHEGYMIHLGRRGGSLIIQAQQGDTLQELLPRHVFGNESSFDLPGLLLHDCVHWLDLRTGVVDIRRLRRVWKESAWILDTSARRAYRRDRGSAQSHKQGHSKRTYLVDPHSKAFATVTDIFRYFEHPSRLIVTQGKFFTVELRRMNLTFHVNKKKLLQCRQLNAEMDPNQDPGTFYGIRSMIVLRDIHNRSQRSIITTTGKANCQRRGMHVIVDLENMGSYARYAVDEILGRIRSPPEPRLLYLQAQLHALTSCFIPDPLTGRTGTEEALSILQSSISQPWIPLSADDLHALAAISSLAPRREYYPPKMKCQQSVYWDSDLTVTIQHDAFEPAINNIIRKSQRLSLFQEATEHPAALKESALRTRAIWRRSIYERPLSAPFQTSTPLEYPYSARDGWSHSTRAVNAREILHLLKERPRFIKTTSLVKFLKNWNYIGGYKTKFAPLLLHECLTVDISRHWGSLVNLCKDCGPEDLASLMFDLGLVSFRDDMDMEIMRTVASFFILDKLKTIEYPAYESFINFQVDEIPTAGFISKLVRPCCSQKFSKKFRLIGSERDFTQECERFAEGVVRQWPCASPKSPEFKSQYLDISEAMQVILPPWERMYQNLQLANHVRIAQEVLDKRSAMSFVIEAPSLSWEGPILGIDRTTDFIPSLETNLMQKQALRHPIELVADRISTLLPTKSFQSSLTEAAEIERIARDITTSSCPTTSQYGRDLYDSIEALKHVDKYVHQTIIEEGAFKWGMSHFNGDIDRARAVVDRCYARIVDSLSADDTRAALLQQANLWPCITPVLVLQQLRSTTRRRFGPQMKESLIAYGLAIVALQRLYRMKDAFARKDEERLHRECQNQGHGNWNPSDYPDWLLLEIDANIQIRDDQVTVAREMISPSSGTNSVLQMNMGQGKTSVIMPMVSAVLADKKKLARILVPRALLSQTAQILQLRLGGLLGRDINHLPFSRRTPITKTVISEYHQFHKEALQGSGIILEAPEHLLAFKLSGLQCVSDTKMVEAARMISIQDWMNSVCRDVLDECDFTLAARTQLIYPSGSQLTLDGHPDRWEVTMLVLDLVARHLPDIARDFPYSVEATEFPESQFPVFYLLRPDAEAALSRLIVNSACDQIIKGCSEHERAAIRLFMADETVDDRVTEQVQALSPKMRKVVYLLRGLLAHGILMLCLKKRWNVQYGLHPNRDPMAVPFHAKGVPSEQAEWGHPDVAILFTCLAFYRQGLDERQLRKNLKEILRSDNPAAEYERWTQVSMTLPEPLRHWNLINVDDPVQIAELCRHLRFKTVVINHFLRHFVFPVHAKQFSVKLQASGWDIPLCDIDGNSRVGTTGFSGTNDNRQLMPLMIKQRDLPELAHTNAMVLTYLLQPRNRGYTRTVGSDGRPMSELAFLDHLSRNEIRVLIDAGAYILGMGNEKLVWTWLQHDSDALAAVYFRSDKPWVLYKSGKAAPLLETPFAENMDNCLVYLDEAHTRGTDLKLPPHAKGALTLGLNQTKDHTVQAAMRLRHLGSTQSVMFFVPPEVHQNILDVCKKGTDDKLDSSHVVTWLLHQTCASNRELQPLYFDQGTDFCRRMIASAAYSKFLSKSRDRKKYMEFLQRPEQTTVEQLYGPSKAEQCTLDKLSLRPAISAYMRQLNKLMQQSNTVSQSNLLALAHVEQQKQVAYEVQEQRQIQRPALMKALKFPGLHPSIVEFVSTGSLKESDVIRASKVLECTPLGSKHSIRGNCLTPHLYVSLEFTRTVELDESKRHIHSFMRPINWVLWSRRTQQALVVIPEETEALIPMFWARSVNSLVHLISYAAPVTKTMLHFNRLDYYSIPKLPESWSAPAWLPFELGVLAGRLYFEFSEYERLSAYVPPPSADKGEDAWTKNHVSFLQDWLTHRRQGQDISHTPMGYLCQGWPLRSDHPFFVERTTATLLAAGAGTAGAGGAGGVGESEFNHDYSPEDKMRLDSDDEVDDADEELDDGLEDGMDEEGVDIAG